MCVDQTHIKSRDLRVHPQNKGSNILGPKRIMMGFEGALRE